MDTCRSHRAGFSFIELLVVMVLVLIIAGMLLPTLSIAKPGVKKAICGNNQREILLAMNVYANDNDMHWPVFTANGAGRWVAIGDPLLDATATAIGSMELTAWSLKDDLRAKVFACPMQPTVRPATEAALTGTTTSVSAWAMQGPQRIGYAYDWSAPANSQSTRVMSADRNPNAHSGHVVMAAFADGHVGNLNRDGAAFLNREADRDDIYTDVDDGPMDTPGDGSATRAFVR